MQIAVPGFIEGLHEDVEQLMYAYGRCRRRAYGMKWKALRKSLKPDRLGVIRQLTSQERIPARYVVTAYDSADTIPAHVTFGGRRLQRFMMAGKISREEYRLRRNNVLACRGEANQKGNLCLRIEGKRLRVTVGDRRWIWLPLLIPEKYRARYAHYLDGSKPYTVLMKRRLDRRGYNVKVTIDVEEPTSEEPTRLMLLDINSGHVDFAVADKRDLKPIAFGKINCHELLDSRKGKNELLIHKIVNKIGNIAKHYDAEVTAGKLRTLTSKKHRHANRRVHRMSQFKFRQVSAYKLPLSGVKYSEHSEAYTSKVGRTLSKPLGLDVHKASAYAFAIKVMDYKSFTCFLRGGRLHEGDGILNAQRSGGKLANSHTLGLQRLGVPFKAYAYSYAFGATPQCKGWGGGFQAESLHASILQVKV